MRRGGIPICFPQFGGFGPLSQHGFCRNSEFKLVDGGSTSVTLSMHTTEKQLKLFPHPFELNVTVSSHVQLHAHTYSGMGVRSGIQGAPVGCAHSPEQGLPGAVLTSGGHDENWALPSAMQCWLCSRGRTTPEYIL